MDKMVGFTPFYVTLVFAFLIIIFLIYAFSRQAKKAKLHLTEISRLEAALISPKEYLSREIKNTSSIMAKASGGVVVKTYNLEGLSLRATLLNIERTNLVDEGRKMSSIREINKLILREIDLRFANKAENKNDAELIAGAQENINIYIDTLKKQLTLQKDTIKKLRKQLLQFDNISIDSFDGDENHPAKLLEETLSDAKSTYLELTSNPPRDDGKFRYLLDGLKEKYDFSLKEVDKLIESNKHKRNLIYKLENEVSKSKGESSESTLKLLEFLKLQLQDSEICTATLELEMEFLRHKTNSIDIEELLAPLKTNKLDVFSQNLMEVITAITQAISVSEIGDIVIKRSSEAGLPLSIKVKSNNGIIWFGPEDIVKKSVKEALINCPLTDEWVELPQGAAINFGNISCIIEGKLISEIDFDLSRFSKVFMVGSSSLKRISLQENSENQRKILISLTEKAKKSIKSLDVQNKYVHEEGRKISESFISNLDEFVENSRISRIQSEMFVDIKEEFLARMDLLFHTGSKLDEAFVELIDLLDSRT